MIKNKIFLLLFFALSLTAANISESNLTIDYTTALKLYKQKRDD